MHKHKHKSKPQAWSPWSEWAWDDLRGCYYRVRRDVNGNYDYDWDNRQTPREVQELTADFRNLSPGSCYDAQDEYTVSSDAKDTSRSSRSKPRAKNRSRDDGDGAGRNLNSGVRAGPESAYAAYGDPQCNGYDRTPGHCYVQSSDTQPRTSFSDSTSGYAGVQWPASAQSANRARPSCGKPPDEPCTMGGWSGGAQPSAAAYGVYYREKDESPPTPKAHILADEDNADELDPRYRVEHSTKFQPGEISKVHWSEPQGSGNEHAPSVSGRQEIQNRFGTKFFVGFRRFIVIANDLGHSTCVPILTYGGKSCKKKGVKPAKHGVIHERGHKARMLEDEPKLGFAPIRVEMTEEGEKLSKESRVNYSKLVTVEHNVKVFFIGSVVAGDREIVQEAVNRCWSDKNHHKKRSR